LRSTIAELIRSGLSTPNEIYDMMSHTAIISYSASMYVSAYALDGRSIERYIASDPETQRTKDWLQFLTDIRDILDIKYLCDIESDNIMEDIEYIIAQTRHWYYKAGGL
jgi:hypothetical protein